MTPEYVDASELFGPDERGPYERKLDEMIEERWGNEQGAEPEIYLRRIALDLLAECSGLRCTEMALRDEIESLRRQLAARVPDVDDLKHRLVAISESISDQDDLEAQAIIRETIRLLSAAPAQPEPVAQGEPVAWMYEVPGVRKCVSLCKDTGKYKLPDEVETPLYTHPQQASKPMTDEQAFDLAKEFSWGAGDISGNFERVRLIRATERHHKIGVE